MNKTANKPDVNDIFFADFPSEVVGTEEIHKYDLRKWLIGNSVMKGWSWQPIGDGRDSGQLTAGILSVRVDLVPEGLRLLSLGREEIVKTKC